jgi:hypothetical protein
MGTNRGYDGRRIPVWELSPRHDSRRLCRILVLTPENRDERLSTWVWSDGNPTMPLFARYLMHTAQMRHQVGLWDRGRSLGGLRAQAADTVARLRAADSRQGRDSVRDVELDTASALAALPAMKHTVEIAAENMSHTLAAAVPIGEGRDLFADDQSLSNVFPTWLDDEIEYLQLDRDLLREAWLIVADSQSHHIDAAPARAARRADDEPSVGILTAMPVECHAMRSLLDNRHDAAVPVDRAHYVRGVLPSRDPERPHVVALVQTGATGTNAAADAATNMYRSIPSVTCLVMADIAAGVPDPANPLTMVAVYARVKASSWPTLMASTITQDWRTAAQGITDFHVGDIGTSSLGRTEEKAARTRAHVDEMLRKLVTGDRTDTPVVIFVDTAATRSIWPGLRDQSLGDVALPGDPLVDEGHHVAVVRLNDDVEEIGRPVDRLGGRRPKDQDTPGSPDRKPKLYRLAGSSLPLWLFPRMSRMIDSPRDGRAGTTATRWTLFTTDTRQVGKPWHAYRDGDPRRARRRLRSGRARGVDRSTVRHPVSWVGRTAFPVPLHLAVGADLDHPDYRAGS